MVEQVTKALVGLLGRAEARELPHRPEAPPIHRRVDSAGERIDAWIGEVGDGIDIDRIRGIKRLVFWLRGRRGKDGLTLEGRLDEIGYGMLRLFVYRKMRIV